MTDVEAALTVFAVGFGFLPALVALIKAYQIFETFMIYLLSGGRVIFVDKHDILSED